MTNREEERHALVSVLVVDDQQLVRDGIASLLRVQDGISVVGTATNGVSTARTAASTSGEASGPTGLCGTGARRRARTAVARSVCNSAASGRRARG